MALWHLLGLLCIFIMTSCLSPISPSSCSGFPQSAGGEAEKPPFKQYLLGFCCTLRLEIPSLGSLPPGSSYRLPPPNPLLSYLSSKLSQAIEAFKFSVLLEQPPNSQPPPLLDVHLQSDSHALPVYPVLPQELINVQSWSPQWELQIPSPSTSS